jgi:hypothetical protein
MKHQPQLLRSTCTTRGVLTSHFGGGPCASATRPQNQMAPEDLPDGPRGSWTMQVLNCRLALGLNGIVLEQYTAGIGDHGRDRQVLQSGVVEESPVGRLNAGYGKQCKASPVGVRLEDTGVQYRHKSPPQPFLCPRLPHLNDA